MTHTPRFLTRPHLDRILRGLRLRMSDGSERIATQLDELQQHLHETEKSFSERQQISQSRHEQQKVAAITAWDTERMAAWDQVERRSFKTVTSVSAQESQLRIDSRKQSEELTNEAKNRIADIERRFMVSKDKTVARLNAVKEQIEQLAGQLAIVQQEVATFLAQRGITASLSEDAALDTTPKTSSEAIGTCVEKIKRTRELLQWLAHNRISRTIESVWFWLACFAVGGLIAGILGATNLLPWLYAALTGVGLSIFVIIVALVAVHPLIRRLVRAELPQLEVALSQARTLQRAAISLAMAENDAELKRIAKKRDDRMQQAVEWRDKAVKDLNAQVKQEMIRLRTFAANERTAVRLLLDQSLRDVDARGQDIVARCESDWEKTQAEMAQSLEQERQRITREIDRTEAFGAQRIRAASQRAVGWITRGRKWAQQYFPRWEQLTTNDRWNHQLSCPVLPLGSVRIDSMLPESVRLDAGGNITAQVNFEPFRDGYLTITADPNSATTRQFIQMLILRALTNLPPGKTQIAVVDPPGLGRDYGWLMHLGDYDPELVTHRVWTQSGHIAKHLNYLALKAEDFIQQSLRNQYATIEDYNRDAGPLAEPYRILVWSSFPLGLDDQCWKPLQSILDTGARCGIIPIFLIDPAQPWDVSDRRDLLMRRGLHVSVDSSSSRIVFNSGELASMPVEPASAPDEQTANQIIHQIGRRARLASRVEVPLAGIAQPRDQWWQGDSTASLEIPIGQSGVGRIQSLKLGVGTAQHAIIAGKTGSGKSTLLHAVITSAAVKYSPERLRLVLLDFKKGVEFQAYSQSQLPHADIIGIESQREFGLSALEYVDHCMQARGQMFRDAGVQDLQSWNILFPTNRSHAC